MSHSKYAYYDIIKKSVEIHGKKYGYLNEYFDLSKVYKFLCFEHGSFVSTFKRHIYHKNGCPKCGVKKVFTTDEFVKKAFEKHRNIYNYDKVDYVNNTTKVIINCLKHGDFKQSPMGHLNGNGCSKCLNSFGTNWLEHIFKKFNIEYVSEKTFSGLKGLGGKLLRYDYYLNFLNILVEFDGKQHFVESTLFGHTNFINTQIHDLIKDQYADKNNIKLIRVDYKYNVRIMNES